jgi:dihydroorotase
MMSWRPAAIARAGERGFGAPIAPGSAAHLVVFDPTERFIVDPASSASRSRNNPFAGRELTGRVRHQLHQGEVVVRDQAATR